jgi:hypothetical protein
VVPEVLSEEASAVSEEAFQAEEALRVHGEL